MNPSQQQPSPPVDARVACADSTNKACPEPTSKLDDHGRGFVIREGGFYEDRQGRRRGPMRPYPKDTEFPFHVNDGYGFSSFMADGSWDDTPTDNDLTGPWIDWKAVAEEALELLHGVYSSGAMMYAPDKLTDEYHALCSKLPNLKGEGVGS